MVRTLASTITEQQLKFCEHYHIHRKPSVAYRYAGYSCNMANDLIAIAAHRLLGNNNICLRLYDLATASDKEFQVTVAEKKQWLKMIVEVSLSTIHSNGGEVLGFRGDPNAAKNAIAELNKMDGHLAPTRKEHTGADGKPIELMAMNVLDYEEVRKKMIENDDC